MTNTITTNKSPTTTPNNDSPYTQLPTNSTAPEVSIITDIFKTVLWEGGKTALNEIAIPYVASVLDPKNTPFHPIANLVTGIQLVSTGFLLFKLITNKDSSVNQIVQDTLYHSLSIFRFERIRRELLNPYLN